MLHFLPGPLQGAIMAILLIINTIFWVTPLYIMVLVKLVLPRGSMPYDLVSRFIAWLAQTWAFCNSTLSAVLMRIEWDIRLPVNLDPRGQYLACANHQSWNDIFVLMRTFGYKAPFFKFFLKQELIWVPLLGLAWWGLDYPFMKRYTRAQVEKNPALKGKDIETTRKACERFRNQPVMVLNFLEGTRFTAEKHARQASPYQNLLKPKSGGFAFALSAFSGQLDSLLDITIVYPDGSVSLWPFLCGKVRRVQVEVRELHIPDDLQGGDYENDAMFRARFHQWIARLWAEKDARIAALKAEAGIAGV